MGNNSLVSAVLVCLNQWGASVKATIGAEGVFAFGSLIRLEGTQFNESSDVDLLIIIPDSISGAWHRARWLSELRSQKEQLELSLMRILKRQSAAEPITSVVAATNAEIKADVHKQGISMFFSSNEFLDLVSSEKQKGLPDAGSTNDLNRLVGECYKYAQGQRNRYLGVSANGSESMDVHDDDDPAPKPAMRHAAMARQLSKPSVEDGADTDVRRGLDFIAYNLYGLEDVNEDYQKLQTKISIRMGARGTRSGITPFEQVLLSELIFDEAFRHANNYPTTTTASDENVSPAFTWSHETVFFAERFASAFPGTRGIEWFGDPNDVKERLAILLKKPLDFKGNCPIWWWRGGNMSINNFTEIGDNKYLMNYEELEIARIAAVQSQQYFRSFVYVEVKGSEPTGLYPDTPIYIGDVANGTSPSPYYCEPFGLVDGVHLVKASEFDDGSARINGSIQSILGRAEPRIRYVTPYNFVISAHDSPISNRDFDSELEKILNGILTGDFSLQDLVESAAKLPKLH